MISISESNDLPDSSSYTPHSLTDSIQHSKSPFSRQDSLSARNRNIPKPLNPVRKTGNLKRNIYFGLQAGIKFVDFKQKELFADDLKHFIWQIARNDSVSAAELSKSDSTKTLKTNISRELQLYDPVILAVPLGLSAGFPISRSFDLMLSGHWFIKQHKALIENNRPDTITVGSGGVSNDTTIGGSRDVEQYYTIQANLLGLGVKFYLPSTFISIENNKSIYISYNHLWNLFNCEIYTDKGSVQADRSWLGSGYEILLGFQVSSWKNLIITGDLGIIDLNFSSSKNWRSILRQPYDKKMDWDMTGLKFNFQLVHQLGAQITPPTQNTAVTSSP